MSQSGVAGCTNSVLSGEPLGKIWSFLNLLIFTFQVFYADFELASFTLSGLSQCWAIDTNKNTANSHKLRVWHHLYKHQQKVTYHLTKMPINIITDNTDRICHPKQHSKSLSASTAVVAVRISIALKEKLIGIKSSISGVGDVPKLLLI